ncbi:hypothetical protein [Pseudoruegeria sp. SK021]|uniref:hypothetical protein n=1 Tax=Pseudoruegeria sp. SK021 TaxID=1933035 RepID=UPI001F0B666D|nr:hypothetical protein [Pseudoruegeria sp. SK021]
MLVYARLLSLWLAALIGLLPSVALAHASDQGFVLLLPTEAYILSGCLAVALTVLMSAVLPDAWTTRLFTSLRLGTVPDLHRLKTVTSCLGFAALVGLVWLGMTGPRDPLGNLLPLTIWTLWWAVFVVVQGCCGDLWSWISPFHGPHRVLLGPQARPLLRLPDRLGHWPAVAIFLAAMIFAFTDLAPDDPARLARVVAGYWLVTFAAMTLFGRNDWLHRGEPFTLLLTLFASLAPLQGRAGAWRFGLPGWCTLTLPSPSISLAVFCLILLGTGSFDGLNETFWWLARLGINPLEFPGRSAVVLPGILGLLGVNLLLIAIFAGCVWLGQQLAGVPVPFAAAFGRLALSILPIALGYHLAHYLGGVLVNSQYALAALSDPFARGDDLLGLGQFYVTTGFFNTRDTVRLLWLTQAGAIVSAHVLAVLMAHRAAIDLYGGGRRALRSQIPLSAFMIAYTLFGLWLLASPRGA